ncbi:MAG: sialate O-acetylesterase [Paludibacter sp.]|nr:sialate O-acetylesterase [Paludibacter sp.]
MRKLILMMLVLCGTFYTTAAEQKFPAVADGYIYQSGDGSNFTFQNMELKKSSAFARELYLSFDIASLTIVENSAFLRLYCNSYDKSGELGISVDGFEGEIPATLKWTTKGELPTLVTAGAEKTFNESQINQYYEWNVSDFVKQMSDKSVTKFSFRVYVTTGNDALLKFNTTENPSFRPELVISETEVAPVTHTIQLPKVFDNKMVLQRNKKVPVWGTANPAKELRLSFNGQQKTVTTDAAGNWKITLDEMTAGGAYEMEIICDKDTVTLTDVLVGDVYLAGGQSNMAFRVASLTAEARAELAQDIEYLNIRYYDVARVVSGSVLLNESDRPWTLCTNNRIDEWSAVATYFARQIHKEEGVPVGIIGCNHGGSTADAWISPAAYADDAALNAAKVAPYTTILQYYCNPSTLYEAMLKKVMGYQLNGFIWYQGEANAKIAKQYETIFSGLIKDWRTIWNDQNLPFIFAQLSSYKPTDDPEGTDWALLREAQLKTAQKLNNVAMVVTADVGELNDIHPKNKKTVGARFTLAAQKMIYSKNIESSGPIFDNVTFSNSTAYISFTHALNGLQSVESTLSEFEICGNDFLYKPANAIIENNRVKVWSDQVPDPVAVRYSWKNGPLPTLYNTEGLPASPFRTMVEPVMTTSHIPFADFSVYSSASYPSREVMYAFNGAGMNNDGLTHANAVNTTTWHSNVGKAYPYFLKVKFNAPELIGKIKVWNFNWTSYLSRGVKDMDIYYSVSEDDLSSVAYTDSRWQKYNSYQLKLADGTAAYLGESFDVDFQQKVKWVGFNILSNQGDANGYVGVSEIQFFNNNTTDNHPVAGKSVMQIKKNSISVNNTFDAPLNLGVVDMMGRTFSQRKIASGELADIALDHLPKNLYLISLQNQQYVEHKKIIIQ